MGGMIFYFCILLCLFQIELIYPQKELNAFLNIPFGTNMEVAKKIILQRHGVKFIRKDKDLLIFTGVNVGGYLADTCYLMSDPFSKNKFYLGMLLFNNNSEELFTKLFNILKDKYGNPDATKTFEGLEDIWYFQPSNESVKNQISLYWVKEYKSHIRLTYDNCGMSNLEFNKKIGRTYKENRKNQLKDF